MFPLSSLEPLKLARAGALAALTLATVPACAEEPVTNLGPVPPSEPILTRVGSKRVLAFYAKDGGQCIVNAVVFEDGDGAPPASRVRMSLKPGQMLHLDSSGNQSVNLQCGDKAETLAVVKPGKFIAVTATN